MKCVRFTDNSAIMRVSDRDAAKLVNSGAAVYVCKGIWKAYRRFLKTKEALMGNEQQ